MATNLDRFTQDLDKLVNRGQLLRLSMVLKIDPTGFRSQAAEQLGKEKVDEYIKKLPDFNTEYEAWYSEGLALLKQLLPDRVANFVALYEKPKNRREVKYGNYVLQDYLQNLKVTFGSETRVDASAAVPQFDQQLSILKAARARFTSSLFEIKQLVQADLFDSELGAARELLKKKFLRAAGVIAGVVLERHLRQVCDDHKVVVTKKAPTLADLSELLKANGVIDIPTWRHLTLLGDIRNICAHSKQQEPTAAQVADLLDGTDKIIKMVV